MESTPPTEVWADHRLVVRTSSIEGCGLFAADGIDAGTVVVRLGGRLVSSTELIELISAADNDLDAPYIDSLTVDENAHLVLPNATIVHFGNHSCDPNVWHVGPYELATRRAVLAGEELTVNYGTNSGADGLVMKCHCGSTQCRGQVTSEDWRRPELQARYQGHWAPALQQRIERS